MKKLPTLLSALAISAGLGAAMTPVSGFAGDNEELIEARKGVMTLYGINMDILGDMVRGDRPFDRQAAQEAADNLLSLANMKNGMLWPRGSSMDDPGMLGQTSAKAAIWENMKDVSVRHKEMAEAVGELAKNAAWSVDALEENLTAVSSTCKGCHKEYRAKK